MPENPGDDFRAKRGFCSSAQNPEVRKFRNGCVRRENSCLSFKGWLAVLTPEKQAYGFLFLAIHKVSKTDTKFDFVALITLK